MTVEFWTMGAGRPGRPGADVFSGTRQAIAAEKIGYDGIAYVDSQNLSGD